MYKLHYGNNETLVTVSYCNDYDDKLGFAFTIYQASFVYKYDLVLFTKRLFEIMLVLFNRQFLFTFVELVMLQIVQVLFTFGEQVLFTSVEHVLFTNMTLFCLQIRACFVCQVNFVYKLKKFKNK